MAKKAVAAWVTCQSYDLTLSNSNTSFIFDLHAQGDDGTEGSLAIKNPKKQAELIKLALDTIAEHWPEFDWQFQVDDDGIITNFK